MKSIFKSSAIIILLVLLNSSSVLAGYENNLKIEKEVPETLDFYALDTYDDDYEYVYTEEWELTKFHSEITINEDSRVEVTETIKADFTNEEHRGVARDIPFEYYLDQWETYKVRLNFLEATNEKGESWDNKTFKEYGYFTIEMRHPDDKLMDGKETFILKYSADKVITYFDEYNYDVYDTFPHDEFYWNVNGTEWVVPSGIVTATINLPQDFNEEDLTLTCFTGAYDESGSDCEWNITEKNQVTFTTTRPLRPYEGLTIIVGMPPGTLTPPSVLKQTYWFLMDNKGIFIAPFTFLIMFFLWLSKGRDDRNVRDTIMPHYKPPKGLRPTETGTIIDEKLDPRDITSTIIDLATRGYIQINEIKEKKKEKFELELIKPYKGGKEFEKLIIAGIFTTSNSGSNAGEKITIDKLKNKFYTHIPKIKTSVMKQLVSDGYFPHNPENVRAMYTTLGSFFLGVPFFAFEALSLATFFGLVLSGVFITLIGFKMPRKTKKGTETYYVLKGLYEYIDTAEKDRMKFQEENNIIFEKLLPYAMSFGLIKKWSKAFDGLITTPPTWFHSYRAWDHTNFRMDHLSRNLNDVGKQLTRNISSKPGGSGGGGGGSWSGSSGFSGGGFSGGGFGGGGGRGL